MSKYDQYIREYLLKAKEVSAEKIGVFSINRLGNDEKVMQTQFVEYKFDKKAETSDELIDFIVKETGKNKTLISSDLSSLFEGARQYINIGKSFSVAGLGILSLNRAGEYEFTPAQGSVGAATETVNTATIKSADENSVKKQTGRNAVIFFAFLIILLVVSGLGWGIYKFINTSKAEQLLPVATDTVANTTPAIKQNANKDSTNNAPTPQINTGDSTNYHFIFETTLNRFRAHNRYDSLKSWGEHVYLDSIKNDTTTVYQLYLAAKLAAQDTAHVKDSIQKYFQRPVKIKSN